MSACKSHQRQIALLAARALSEDQTLVVRDHLRDCAHCRQYAEVLERVVGLYVHDAERPIPAPRAAARPFEAPPAPWLRWLFPPARPAVICLGMLLLAAMSLLFKKPSAPNHAVSAPTHAEFPPAQAPTIANLRHLANVELDELARLDQARTSPRRDFVYSVGTRPEASN